jgi:hypothetical protein
MRIRTDFHPDDRAGSALRHFYFDGRQVEIVETIDQWYGPDYRYLKVRGDDGSLYILHFDEPHEEWALIMYRRAQTEAARTFFE